MQSPRFIQLTYTLRDRFVHTPRSDPRDGHCQNNQRHAHADRGGRSKTHTRHQLAAAQTADRRRNTHHEISCALHARAFVMPQSIGEQRRSGDEAAVPAQTQQE
jgi:hypothetical protein